MIKSLLLSFSSLFILQTASAQCDSININSNHTVSTDALMSGTYVIQGTFTLPAGVTIFVTPYNSGGCGELKIYAENIIIEGTINGDYAGFEGGTGGSKGLSVNSITGHANSLTACNDEDTEGHISTEGGIGGENGNGPGAGIGGADGNDGAGTKQTCYNTDDEGGVVGGSGGAGGGSGASYGGVGGDGLAGGNGTNTYNGNMTVQNAYAVVSGNGGNGGIAPNIVGTQNGRDIQLGSGGAGAGGGGRSYYLGTNGAKGGDGGGLVFLKANNQLTLSGAISVNGQDGSYGGAGGSGDATSDCCSDGCNGCDERTFSCGAGAGSGSGGGSGGGIFIESLGSLSFTGTLSAKGGNGGNGGTEGYGANCTYDGGVFCGSHNITTGDGNSGNEGGSGGGGRIKLYYLNCSNAIITGTSNVDGGVSTNSGANGTISEVCGYTNLDELNDLAFNVYPNPFENIITIKLEKNIQHEIRLVDTKGMIIQSIQNSEQQTTIDVATLNSGMYFLEVLSSGSKSTKKIIKR